MSLIYKPYRAIGIYSGTTRGVLHFHRRRRYHIIEIPIENAFHSYKVDGLGIIHLSDPMPEKITGLSHHHIFVSAQTDHYLWVFFNGKVEYKFTSEHKITLHFLMSASLLVYLDDTPSLYVYDFREDEVLCSIPLESHYKFTGIIHPPTYQNKVVLSTTVGHLIMFNVKTSKKIHTFKAAGESRINSMIKTPHLHVIGVACQDGTFKLINLKMDEVVLKVSHTKPVISCDVQTEQPIVACGLTDGSIYVWDLEEMQLISKIEAHISDVCSISYLPQEDSFVSIGSDNSVRVYVDNKQHRERYGHAKPPAYIDFYGSDDKHTIVSAGLDKTLKLFSPEHESGNRNLGRTTLRQKSTKAEHDIDFIQYFSTSKNRETSWDNLVAIHNNASKATSWSTHRYKRGKLTFSDGLNKITSVECSHCGNMVWIGYENGKIIEYNMQSGKQRKTFVGHDGPILGLGSQMLQVALISIGEDATLRAWRIRTGKELEKLILPEVPQLINFQRRTNLAAVALADYTIMVVDCTNHPLTISRVFRNHTGRITSLCWRDDSRWLVSASEDCSIRTWDVPTGQLIDQFRTAQIPTNVAFSPNDQFLATTHVDKLGIYLWSNINAYNPRPFAPVDASVKPVLVSTLPEMRTIINDIIEEDDIKIETIESDVYKSPPTIEDCLSVSGLPNSRWTSLINLKLIKSRNKVVNIKPPEKAPFFLPVVAGLDPKFNRSEGDENSAHSQLIKNSKPLVALVTDFGRQMERYMDDGNCRMELMSILKTFSPSKIDSEIASLDPEGCCTTKPLKGVIKLITDCLSNGLYWDACEAILRVILQKHLEAIVEDEELMETVQLAKEATNRGRSRVERYIEESLLLSQFIINNTIAVQE